MHRFFFSFFHILTTGTSIVIIIITLIWRLFLYSSCDIWENHKGVMRPIAKDKNFVKIESEEQSRVLASYGLLLIILWCEKTCPEEKSFKKKPNRSTTTHIILTLQLEYLMWTDTLFPRKNNLMIFCMFVLPLTLKEYDYGGGTKKYISLCCNTKEKNGM